MDYYGRIRKILREHERLVMNGDLGETSTVCFRLDCQLE